MKNKSFGITRFIILAVFLLAAVLSVIINGKVNINYNISDYLDDETETKISLNIIEDEFGMTGDIQVMVEDVDADTAKDIQNTIKNISNVLAVNFNENDDNYYKDGNALFTVLVDGDEYSDVANTVLDEIGDKLDDEFTVNYGGSVVSKKNLRMAIQREVIVILAIALCLVVLLMLLTSSSWLEPFVLLSASGVAVLMNMGTNIIFGEISYITNAVASILQLALSIDYSIVLLHEYHTMRENEDNCAHAMMRSIKHVLKPITASALTTMTGLLALLFMSMRIGFDIGIVLMKGIVMSALVSLTLLPALLLIFEKIMAKTSKRPIVIRGDGFCKLAIKAGKVIVPVALAVIIVCGLVQTKNTYSFTDSSGDNPNITDVFGKNNAVIVVYPNENNDYSSENALADKLLAYKDANGKTVIKDYTAYSNTVKELYDIDKATQTLNMPRADVEMLFVMYHIYNDSSRVEMKPLDFLKYTDGLVKSDADAQSMINDETAKAVRTLIAVDEIMNGAHTSEQFTDLVGEIVPDSNLKLFSINQMYGLYCYDSVENKKVDFETMLKFAASAVNGDGLGDLIDEDAASGIVELSEGLDQFNEQMDKQMTAAEFREYMLTEQGIEISAEQMELIYLSYFASSNNIVKETIQLLPLLNYLVEAGQVTDADAISGIESLNELEALDVAAFREQMERQMTAVEFREYMIAEQGITLDQSQVDLLYSAYSANDKGLIEEKITVLPLINYLVEVGLVTDAELVEGVGMLNELAALDVPAFRAQMNKPMTVLEFRTYMREEFGVEISNLQAMGLYYQYFESKGEERQNTIPFISIINYLVEAGHVTDAETISYISMVNDILAMDLEGIKEQISQQMTAAELSAFAKSEYGIEISEDQMNILYAAYFASENDAVMDKIAFLPLMNYIIDMGQVTDPEAIATIETANEIYAMDLEGIKEQMHRQMSADELREYMLTEQGIEISDDQAKIIYAAYSAYESGESQERITFLPLMNYLADMGQITDADAMAKVDALNDLYAKVPNVYSYEEFLPMVEQMVTTLTGEPMPVEMDALAIQQLYIMYFYDNDMIPEITIVGRDFVDFVLDTAKTNSIVSSQLPTDIVAKLYDVIKVDAFLLDTDTYDFKEMTQKISDLQGSVTSISASDELDESAVSGVYIKYAVSEKLGLDEPIMACDLLGFVVDNMDSNRVLGSKMSDAARDKLAGAQEAMQSAEKLLIGENYSRMLLSVDLPSESAESSEFVRFLSAAVKECLGEDAHIAGEMVSTYDLQESFDYDNKLISIFTIVSIFIIVMIIFRSLSLPVVLVAVIQGAIWISMSTSIITGPMFFMSYIMATCILMGSTIDYGILMSTSYVQLRADMDRKEALYRSVKAAMPTVFTSGLILTICGFVVGFIASQNSIATVGVLLGKGTLVSVAMITVVLPSILYLLDGFILKLSVKPRKNKKDTKDKI